MCVSLKKLIYLRCTWVWNDWDSFFTNDNNDLDFKPILDLDLDGDHMLEERIYLDLSVSTYGSADCWSLVCLGKCPLRWKFAKYVCVHAWWANQLKNSFFLLAVSALLCLKQKFHICGMRIQICMRHCGSHVFRTSLSTV